MMYICPKCYGIIDGREVHLHVSNTEAYFHLDKIYYFSKAKYYKERRESNVDWAEEVDGHRVALGGITEDGKYAAVGECGEYTVSIDWCECRDE